MAETLDKELHKMVLDIVNELESAVAGTLYHDDGDFTTIDDADMDEYLGSHDTMPEKATLDEVIGKRGLGDTRFEVDSKKELWGGKTLFTFGGPNIWVHDDRVCGYWGAAKAEIPFNSEARSALYDWFKASWEGMIS